MKETENVAAFAETAATTAAAAAHARQVRNAPIDIFTKRMKTEIAIVRGTRLQALSSDSVWVQLVHGFIMTPS